MDAIWIIPIALVLLIVIGLLFVWQKGTKANMDRYDGDVEAAMSDDEASIPATPFIPDPATALGDTAEAHAEIDPHDIPVDAPERQAAEERFERTGHQDQTTERTGERQRSAPYAKGAGGSRTGTDDLAAGEKTDVPGQRP